MMQDKSGTIKVNDENEKKYSLLGIETLKLWAHLEGYNNVKEVCFKLLAEDLAYRLHEILDVGYLIVKSIILNNHYKYCLTLL